MLGSPMPIAQSPQAQSTKPRHVRLMLLGQLVTFRLRLDKLLQAVAHAASFDEHGQAETLVEVGGDPDEDLRGLTLLHAPR